MKSTKYISKKLTKKVSPEEVDHAIYSMALMCKQQGMGYKDYLLHAGSRHTTFCGRVIKVSVVTKDEYKSGFPNIRKNFLHDRMTGQPIRIGY